MKYRGNGAHRRFYHQNAEDYSEDDQENLRKYMREKGYKRPVDVWFNNIAILLEIEIDTERKWMAELIERIYPDDAQWAISHMQSMYLAICTPSNQDDEFLLTENAYSIHEGPVSCVTNLETGEVRGGTYTEFHVFAVISPKLILVLRNFLLPVPEEDRDPSIRAWREKAYALNASQHSDPSRANSCLQDLPVGKAHNSYTNIVGGKFVLKDGEDGTSRSYHRFCFRFFPTSTRHVNIINSIMLEESYAISTIAFKSKSSARKALEFYLTLGSDDSPKFKNVTDTPGDSRLACLKKLEQVAKELGSDSTAVYHVVRTEQEGNRKLESLSQQLDEHLSNVEPSDTMKLYMKLGQFNTKK